MTSPTRHTRRLVDDVHDPSAWLAAQYRRWKARQCRPKAPTRHHLGALLQLIFDGCEPISTDGNALVFLLTLDPDLADLIAQFGAIGEDFEDGGDDEDGHDREAGPYPAVTRFHLNY